MSMYLKLLNKYQPRFEIASQYTPGNTWREILVHFLSLMNEKHHSIVPKNFVFVNTSKIKIS